MRYDSLTYPQFGFKLKENKLYLSKIGDVKVNVHRPVEGEVRRIVVRRNSRGKFFVSMICEVDAKPLFFKDGCVVGVDVGLESFATLSNGEKIANPRLFRSEEAELARAQRRLSAEKIGSAKWRKRLKVVERVHERIGNRRGNFVHQESRRLVDCFGVVVFEGLSVRGMMRGYFGKSIGDAGWSMFVNATRCKAVEAGSRVVLVNPNGTSQLCSRCGLIVKKSLGERVHRCECGLVLDRDVNAAVNILRLGLQSLGLKTIEAHPLQGGSGHFIRKPGTMRAKCPKCNAMFDASRSFALLRLGTLKRLKCPACGKTNFMNTYVKDTLTHRPHEEKPQTLGPVRSHEEQEKRCIEESKYEKMKLDSALERQADD